MEAPYTTIFLIATQSDGGRYLDEILSINDLDANILTETVNDGIHARSISWPLPALVVLESRL